MDKISSTKMYQELYEQYKELVNKTKIRVYSIAQNENINVEKISPNDLKEREKIENKLKEGLDFLTDNQLIELSGDSVFTKDALDILIKRKETL